MPLHHNRLMDASGACLGVVELFTATVLGAIRAGEVYLGAVTNRVGWLDGVIGLGCWRSWVMCRMYYVGGRYLGDYLETFPCIGR